MGRAPGCYRAWTIEEDSVLIDYINAHGASRWRSLPERAGLEHSGKSCRLRWLNYLRPDIKRGNILPEEEELIIRMHRLLGNRWSLIAGRLPGRTGHEIKNYWSTHICKKHMIENGIVNDESLCLENMQKDTVSKKKALEMKSAYLVKPRAVTPHDESVTDRHSHQLLKDFLLSVDSMDLDTSNLSLDFLPPLTPLEFSTTPVEFSTDFSVEDCEIKGSLVIVNPRK